MRTKILVGLVLVASLFVAGACAQRPLAAKRSALAGHALPIPALDRPLPAKTLEGLREAIGDARVVGLGESRHDTREQTQLKGRLLRHLVEDLGFRALILEESLPHGARLGAVLEPGGPDPAGALGELAGWYLWDTEEFLAELHWLCAYNAPRVGSDRVVLTGMDITAPALGARRVLAALREAGLAAGIDEEALRLDLHAGEFWPASLERVQGLEPAERARIGDAYAALVAASAGLSDQLAMPRLARAAAAGHAMFSAPTRAAMGALREQGMAEVVLDLLEHELAGRRVVLWAHNLHVAKAPFRMPAMGPEEFVPLGHLLDAALGADYVAIGASFAEGRFDGVFPPGPRTFPLSPPDTMDGALAASCDGACLLDLRRVDDAAREWLNQPRTWRAQDADATLVPADGFDAVFHVPEVTRARPGAAARRRYATSGR